VCVCVCVCVCVVSVCVGGCVSTCVTELVDLDIRAVLVDIFCDFVTVWLLRGLYYLLFSMLLFV
jgi:hypothetical protein